MRIVQVVGHAAGGIGVHVRDLVAGLREAGDRVAVVAPQDTADRFGLSGARPEAWPRWSRPASAARSLRALRALARGADVVHAQGHQAGVAAIVATTGLDVPVIVSWHNQVLGSRGTGGVPAELAERWQARRAALVTGASLDLVERARELGARAAEEAPVAAPAAGTYGGSRTRARSAVGRILGLASGTDPGVDPGTDPHAGEHESHADEVWVLVVSRLAPQKDLPVLAAAARRLAARAAEEQAHTGERAQAGPAGVPLRWILVGDGDAAIRDELTAATAGLPFHLVGARDDVPTFMAAADLLVVPSRWEARALVVQEALAAGLPVVATDVGGLPELVTGCGLLVPVGDDTALAWAVDLLAQDATRRSELGARARARFAELPTPAEVTAAWRGRYGRVLRVAATEPGA